MILNSESHDHDEHDHEVVSVHDTHDHSGNLWEDAWAIFTDPAHILPEIAWHLIMEVVVITFIYGIVIKKFIIPKLRNDIHREIDEAHDTTH